MIIKNKTKLQLTTDSIHSVWMVELWTHSFELRINCDCDLDPISENLTRAQIYIYQCT